MANAIEDVLNDLGWNEGFRIPIANEENKRLEQEVERKSRERASLKAQLEALSERTRELRAHAADVRQEQAQNGRLLLAHSAQLEQERRAYSEAQIDESRLSAEARQWEKDSAAAQAKIDKLEASVQKLTRKLEAASNNVKIDRQRLLAWEEQLSRKEQKNLVIEQFVKSDEKTFKKIELERQTLSEKAEVYRQAVAKAVADVNEMDRK